jgi:membrane protease subunit HflC
MKNIAIPILIAVIFIVLATYLVAFQVRETELAFVTRFGKPVRSISEPGLKFKWPAPIERVQTFDSRMRVLEPAQLSETTTKGAIPIIVNTYVVWRIAEPLKFYNSIGAVDDAERAIKEAERKLSSQINDTQNRIIGQHTFAEFVNSDPQKIKLDGPDGIQAEMLADLDARVQDQYGIKIETLGIKQLKISEDVTQSVFERMKAERKRLTDDTITRGEAEAARIRADADRVRKSLLAEAQARAKAIRGRGDAEAAKYYKMLEANPELAIFLRNLEALATMLKDRATLVIPTDVEPFKLLREMPSLQAGEGQ